MPVTIKQSPFDRPSTPRLPLAQARVLFALPPITGDDEEDWPCVSRDVLCVRAGFSARSGSLTRALDGIRQGNATSGKPHAGLLTLGYVLAVSIDVDGLEETNYRITQAGVDAFSAYVAAGGTVPPVKDASLCVNKRYQKDQS